MNPAALAARLNEAAQAGTPVTIVYRDAGRPETTYRMILPIAASARVLRARDLASNQLRVFLLSQIELVTPDTPSAGEPPGGPPVAPVEAPQVPPAPPTPRLRTAEESLAAIVDELERLGWHVVVRGTRLSIHLSYSTGKPMKTAAGVIAQNAAKTDAEPGRRRRRPWFVAAPGLPKARTFVTAEQAVALFLDHARAHAPSHRRRSAHGPPAQ